MSAKKKIKEFIEIDVTRGDCVEDNRKTGKSNTGTYFISSLNDFFEFEDFFKETNRFYIDILKVIEYKILFKVLFENKMDEYKGAGHGFDNYVNYFVSLNSNPLVEITLRKNDTRVFMRFKDNNNLLVKSFRNLLYEDLSKITIEKRNKDFFVYPSIILDSSINENNGYDESFTLDE